MTIILFSEGWFQWIWQQSNIAMIARKLAFVGMSNSENASLEIHGPTNILHVHLRTYFIILFHHL